MQESVASNGMASYGLSPIISRYSSSDGPISGKLMGISSSSKISVAPRPVQKLLVCPATPGATGASVPLDGGLLLALLAGVGIGLNLLHKKKDNNSLKPVK
jgi:hypothetical protein